MAAILRRCWPINVSLCPVILFLFLIMRNSHSVTMDFFLLLDLSELTLYLVIVFIVVLYTGAFVVFHHVHSLSHS